MKVKKNAATIVNESIPHCHTYAPTKDTGYEYEFNEDGSFKLVDFVGAKKGISCLTEQRK